MTHSRYITVDPNICHGRPCFRGTRVLVAEVLDLLADGQAPDRILRDAYPQLKPAHIRAALSYAAALAHAGRVVSVQHPSHAVADR